MADPMKLGADELEAYIAHALDAMTHKATALGDRVSERPSLDGANSVYALTVHCMEVTRFWLDHVVCANPSERDRDAEFAATGTVSDLEAQVVQFKSELPAMVRAACAVDAPLNAEWRDFGWWPFTTVGVSLHVIEELYQHLGHVDITVDLLQSGA
ncbi:MAG: DUF664 domain-containing protein [Acidobacteria bacterium]|nr:DUF664 domain-containing protein [Acidobacteriota bacterium]